MARKLIILGTVLVLLALLTGSVSSDMANPRMGLSAHLAGLMNGTLLIALGAGWGHVRLVRSQERVCWWLLAYGSVTNWLALLLAAVWGAGRAKLPIAAAQSAAQAAPWQEQLVTVLLISMSAALIIATVLVLHGLLVRRQDG